MKCFMAWILDNYSYISFLEAAYKLEVFLLQLHCMMDNEEYVDLPFKVGQMAESRSLQQGFRGAWFRCKVSIGCMHPDQFSSIDYFRHCKTIH
jgi:hypothetical protein